MTAMLASGFKTLGYYVGRAPSGARRGAGFPGDMSVLQNKNRPETSC